MSYKNAKLYASKVYEEHPVALWSFDEDITFYSLISDSEKTVSTDNWTISANAYSASVSLPENPIDNSPMRNLYASGSVSSIDAYITTAIDTSTSPLDDEKESICFSLFINAEDVVLSSISNIRVGFIINSASTFYTEYSSTFFIPSKWGKIEHTQDTLGVTTFTPYLKITYNDGSAKTLENSSVTVAGLSCGQWSEKYNSRSSGLIPSALSSSITTLFSLPGALNGIQIDPYGLDDTKLGYAIELDKRILAVSSGIPMTYGAKSNISILPTQDFNIFSTSLDGGATSSTYDEYIDGGSPSSTYTEIYDGGDPTYVSEGYEVPSLIFMSQGFLNESGNYSNLTAEFWMRILPLTNSHTRIFGPLNSKDGIYVDGNFITVQVDKYKQSYFISQWYRPMLVHFIQTPTEIALLINSEKVISIAIDNLTDLDFNSSEYGYVGFFGSQNILNFEIDSFSIFPYAVSSEIAKRRFIYGQGVDEQENIAYSNKSDLTYIDFPFVQHSSTISYPNKTSWSDGYFNNVTVSKEGLEPLEYTTPDIIFTNASTTVSDAYAEQTWNSFEQDNYLIQDDIYPFINMRPNASYDEINSTIYFTSINKLKEYPASIHAVLKTGSGSSSYIDDQSLLYFSSLDTTDYLEIKIASGSLQYIYNDDTLYSEVISDQTEFCAGIKFDSFIESYSQTQSLLSNVDRLSLNFGGYNDRVFSGNIYSLTINNDFCSDMISETIFDGDGIAYKTGFASMFSYVGSYTLIPVETNSSVYLDVATFGYWEESYPLTYFGKSTSMSAGIYDYDLDMIQFNIDIPSVIFSASSSLSENFYDYSNIKAYITLQSSASVGQIPYTDYINTVNIRGSRIVNFDSLTGTNNTKYEICDGTVIYPPKDSVNFEDYYITIHLEIMSNGVNTQNIKMKKMSLSSSTYDDNGQYTILTPTGRDVVTVAKSGSVSLYNLDIPFVVNTESSPYLYITGNSGITTVPTSSSANLGTSFVINQNLKTPFEVVGLQAYLMYNKSSTFSGSVQIGSFYNTESSLTKYDMWLVPELDSRRAFLKIFDSSTNQEMTGFKYYMNGNIVSKIPVTPLEWISFVISFDNPVKCIPGYLDFYSGIAVDNVAIFDRARSKDSFIEVSDTWSDISSGIWSAIDTEKTWDQVYNSDQISTGNYVDGSTVFETYSGISSIINSDNSDTFNVSFDSAKVINDITWSSFEVSNI